ncbi:MAG: carboxypeptidase regulatory-like domain-containing protein, partial [Candidatus Magnetomorum sp.]|nr:carboxypeptidase regulatory-like domain-containing protein [Candidatus Magnetomorum sp.]
GTDLKLQFLANSTFEVQNVFVNGEAIGSLTEYTLRSIAQNYTISASFIEQPIIIASAGTNGNIQPSGTIRTTVGASQAFKIIPNEGFKIDTVLMDNKPISSPPYVFMDLMGQHSISATFNKYALNISVGPNGSIEPDIQSMDVGGDYSLIITPDEGFEIDTLKDNGKSQEAISPYLLWDISSDHQINVTFKTLPMYSISVTCNKGGSITPDGELSIMKGKSLAVDIVPDDRYFISDLVVDGQTLPAQSTYVLNDIKDNHEILANFTAETWYAITSSAGDGGSIDPQGIIEKKEHDVQIYQIIPDDLYQVVNVFIDDVPMGAVNSIAVKADNNHRVYASFESTIRRTIQGYVKAENTNIPLENYWVELWNDETFVNGVHTDEQGFYTIENIKQSDQYIIAAWPPEDNAYYICQFYSQAKSWEIAERLTVMDNDLSDIDFYLKPTDKAGFSGQIRTTENIPVANARVNALRIDQTYVKETTTDASGYYTITGLSPENTYFVSFFFEETNKEYYYTELSDDPVPLTPTVPVLQNIDIVVEPGETISGFVQSYSGNAVAGIKVNAISEYLNEGNAATTDSNGQYTIVGLKIVSSEEASEKGYIVEIQPSIYPYQVYPYSESKEQGQKVATNSGNINFKLRKGNAIYGAIKNNYEEPMSGIAVVAWAKKDFGNIDYKTQTNEDGTYALTDLPISDDYIVGIFPENLSPQYYQFKDNSESATLINIVNSGQSDITFTIDNGGRIMGDISYEGTKMSGLKIELTSSSQEFHTSVQSDNLGHFEIRGLDKTVTDYLLVVRYPYCLPYMIENIQPSEISHDIQLIKSINISGRIIYVRYGISNATIHAQLSDKSMEVSTISNRNGYFSLTGLKQGEWQITVKAAQFTETQKTLNITNNFNTNFYLSRPPTRYVYATIIGLNKSERMKIQAWSDIMEYGRTLQFMGNGTPLRVTLPLLASSDYTLELQSDDFPDIYYDNALSIEDAKTIDLSEDHVRDLVIRVHQDTSSDISGVISFPKGTPRNQGVTLHVLLDGQKQHSQTVMYYSMYDMPYVIQGLPKRDNYLIFADSTLFMQKYYSETESGGDYITDATVIDISENPAENIDLQLTIGGSIDGYVYDAQRNRLTDVRVEVWSESIQKGKVVTPNSSAYFKMSGLNWASDYKLRVIRDNAPIVYYTSFGTVNDINIADELDINLSHKHERAYIYVKEGESIYGTVRNTNDLPLRYIWVSANSDIMKASNGVYTDSEGNFILNGLPESNDYKVTAYDRRNEYLAETYQNISTGTQADFVLNARLGYMVTGRILNQKNQPVRMAKVEIESAGDHRIYSVTRTDYYGNFRLPRMPVKSDYFLQVWPYRTPDAYHIDYPIELDKNIEKTIYLEPGLTISGYIKRKEDQRPLYGIYVRIASESLHLNTEVRTNRSGYFEFPNAKQASDYIITAAPNSTIYHPVQIEDCMPSEGYNFILESSWSIEGQIRDRTSKAGIPNALVEVYSQSRQGMEDYSGVVYTDENGFYKVDNLTRFNEQGSTITDYIILIHADGYCYIGYDLRYIKNIFDIELRRGSMIRGKIQNDNFYGSTITVLIYDDNGSYLSASNVYPDGYFYFGNLDYSKRYQLFFTGSLKGKGDINQWAGKNDIGVSDRSQAISYAPESYLYLTFDLSLRHSPILSNTDRIRKIHSTTQSFRMVRNKRDENPEQVDTLNVPPISNKSKISVNWEGNSDDKYYVSFSENPDFEFKYTNLPEVPPIRTRKITSKNIEGDDVNHYFHVAPIDKDGRIGKTTSIAFRIDTTPPQNVCVIPPITTSTRNIQLQLGASGATEVYISNLNYQEGGQWDVYDPEKQWEIDHGYGAKTIYVRFRDRADNQTMISGETLFNQAIPTFTINTLAGENGIITPDGLVEAPQASDICFNIIPDDGFRIDRFVVDQLATPVTDHQYCFTDVQADHNLQVAFSLDQYFIQSTCDTNGQIYPSGKITVDKGASQTFVMTPKDGYQIDNLTVDLQNTPVQDNNYTLSNIQDNHDVFVSFKRVYNISATSSGKGAIKPSGIVTVNSGKSASFELLPDPGYTIDSLMVDGHDVNKNDVYTFLNVNGNHSIHVTFQRQLHSIQAIKGIGGRIEPEGLVSVASGETQQFTIFPDQGYTINHVIIDGKTIVRTTKRSNTSVVIHDYAFSDVSDDHTIVVSFMPIMRLITATSGPNGNIAPSGDVMINDGSSITFTVFPSDGFVLDTLQLDQQTETVVNNQLSLENVNSNHNIHATFKRVFKITSISGANGHIEPEGVIMAEEHSNLTLTIIPDDTYELASLTADGIEMAVTDNTITLKYIQKDQTLIASFQLKQFTIIAQAGNHGSIEPSGEFLVDAGAKQTFVIQPDVGCQIKSLNVNGETVLLSGNQYSIENIDKDYTIEADFVVINNAPVISDASISIFEDTPINLTLTANDLDNDEVTFYIQTPPDFGTYTLTNLRSGYFEYTPNHNYFGNDAFTFMANDGKINSNTATISITITPVNDIPQSYGGEIQLAEDSSISSQLTAFDADNDPLSYTIATKPQKGVAEITNLKTGTFVYTPYPDSNGADSFTFTVSDTESTSEASLIEISIASINDLPHTTDQLLETGESESIDITLMATDKDLEPLNFYLYTLPLHGQIVCMGYTIDQVPAILESPHIVYAPEPGYRGIDNLTYYVNDGETDSNISE